MTPAEVDALLPYCTTDRQRETLEACRNATFKSASKTLGIAKRNVERSISLVRNRAALQGYSPAHDMTRTVPDGYKVKGVSSYYNKDGNLTGQWVKSSADAERQAQMMIEAANALSEELPRLSPIKAPSINTPYLLNLYTLTDCHVGMLAWHKEGGADWDLNIAERTLTGCFEQMVLRSPDADTCVIAQLGDWLHQDGLMPVTPTSGHVLDSDGRFSKVVGASIRILRRVIDLALSRHKKVILLMAEGNHDLASSVWLRHMFIALYEREKRLSVIDCELPYYAHQHGNVMLAWHHGHMKKNQDLPLLFAAQYPKVWGMTEKRYCHTGHRHHVEEKEHSGMMVIQHPTLAARDAYAARGGWISERQATAITYHQQYGQVARTTITPEMLG